jgi:hypothetical protein
MHPKALPEMGKPDSNFHIHQGNGQEFTIKTIAFLIH